MEALKNTIQIPSNQNEVPMTPPTTPSSSSSSPQPTTTASQTIISTPLSTKRHAGMGNKLQGGISKGDIRRLARRGGVVRMNGKVYDETCSTLKEFLNTIIQDSVTYANYAHRSTVTTQDVRYALKKNGITMYGF
jgi:histone H4